MLSGSSKIEFKPPLKVEGREHKNFRFSKRYIAENWYNDRNLKMRESIAHLVKNNREDNLLILLAGLLHTLDYFLVNKDQTCIYASYPFKEETRFKTADHYQVLDYLGVEDEAELRGADQSALMLLGVYGQAYYQASRGNKLSLDPLEVQDVNNSSEIIISDFHAIRDYQLARDLPKSSCLNSLGYKSVTFAIEFGSLYAGSAYNFQAVWDKFELEKITGPSHMENIKKLSPSAYNLIKSGKAQIYPNILEILTKVKEWETAGIPVRYTGIE